MNLAFDDAQERDGKEAAIVAAARKTFLAQGFDSASMDRIAQEAGVSKRTVYNRFRSKEDLFAAAIEESCRNILPVDVEVAESSLSTAAFVSALAHAFLRGLLQPDALALRRIAAFEAGRNPALGRLFLAHGPARIAASYAPILDRVARREGLAIPDVEVAIYQLGALISEPLHTEALFGAPPDDLEAAIDAQIERALSAFWKIYG
jgi:TetR/AcrR family transcriptional repressor of mexJK operon